VDHIKPAILWFRQDLRLEDNPALQAASRAILCLAPSISGMKRILGHQEALPDGGSTEA